MILAIVSLLAGIVCGRWLFSPEAVQFMDTAVTYALRLLVFTVGIDIGTNKSVFSKLKQHRLRILLIPLGVIAGSLCGSIIAGYFLGIPANESAALGAGMGWYSLSAILLRDMATPQLGTVAFLCNIFRELLAFLLIPLVARYLNKYAAIAPGGATSMDTTLPMIAKYTDEETAILAVVSGVLCTASVPLIVPLVYRLF